MDIVCFDVEKFPKLLGNPMYRGHLYLAQPSVELQSTFSGPKYALYEKTIKDVKPKYNLFTFTYT